MRTATQGHCYRQRQSEQRNTGTKPSVKGSQTPNCRPHSMDKRKDRTGKGKSIPLGDKADDINIHTVFQQLQTASAL